MNTPQIKDGGSAFPLYLPQEEGDIRLGMSLRDYFAGQALSGYLATWTDNSDGNLFELYHVGKTAYSYADAMLKAREVKP